MRSSEPPAPLQHTNPAPALESELNSRQCLRQSSPKDHAGLDVVAITRVPVDRMIRSIIRLGRSVVTIVTIGMSRFVESLPPRHLGIHSDVTFQQARLRQGNTGPPAVR